VSKISLPVSDSFSWGAVGDAGSSSVLRLLLVLGLLDVAVNGWRAAPFLGLLANFLASARRRASKMRNLRQGINHVDFLHSYCQRMCEVLVYYYAEAAVYILSFANSGTCLLLLIKRDLKCFFRYCACMNNYWHSVHLRGFGSVARVLKAMSVISFEV